MTTPDRNELTIKVVSGPSTQEVKCDSKTPLTLGRERECELCLADGGVSRRHAEIKLERGRPVIVDLGSRHGTFVNTIRLDPKETVPLRDGDTIEISPFTLTVSCFEGSDELSEDQRAAPPKPITSDRYVTRASLFGRLQEDDTKLREASWQEFVEKYRPIILGFARNAGLAASDREDVMQEVLVGFLRVHEKFEYDPQRGRFRGYLKRAVLSAIRARLRKKRAVLLEDESSAPDPKADQLDSLWSRQWTSAALEDAMHEAEPMFEDRTWQAFELYGRRGVPAKEVAEQLGMSEEAVRHAKSRVAREVRGLLVRAREATLQL